MKYSLEKSTNPFIYDRGKTLDQKIKKIFFGLFKCPKRVIYSRDPFHTQIQKKKEKKKPYTWLISMIFAESQLLRHLMIKQYVYKHLE